MKSIPNYFTLSRLALIPIFFVIYYLPFIWAHWLAALIFALAALTDWLDGYLARTLKQSTPFGAFLDPVVDKLMVATSLVMLAADPHLPTIVVPAVIIVGREIVISALREWMAELGKRATVAVSFIGKAKTAFQLVSLVILLAYHSESPAWSLYLGVSLLYFSALLTLWSMVIYLKISWSELMSQSDGVENINLENK